MTTRDQGSGSHDPQSPGSSSRTWTRRSSFTLIVVIYVVAVTACLIVADSVGLDHPSWAVAAGFLASTAMLYVASQIVGNGSTFDAWWSVMPVAVAAWMLLAVDHAGDEGFTAVLRPVVVLLVVVWGIRLTANWALGWSGLGHEDWRYVKLYGDVPMPRWLVSLLTVHLFPTVTVAVACLPLVAVLTRPDGSDGWPGGTDAGDVISIVIGILGVVVTAGAILIEHLADVELRAFNRRKRPGDLLDTGWWARSRHPNYLGEMGFWWGLGFCAIAVDPAAWWTLVGPVVITVMFLTASIPLLETRSAERRPGWAEYCSRTPMLLPRLSRR